MNLCVLAAVLTALLATDAQAEIRVWAAGSTEKIQDRNRSSLPHKSIWNESTRTVRIDGVRGERVPFQVVITADHEDVHDVTLAASDLSNDKETFSNSNVEMFYEHLIKIYAPSGRHGQRGYWPDALVPLTRPFRVHADPIHKRLKVRNQPIWVELTIPRDQPAGIYHGAIEVASRSGELEGVNVELTVWDIELPEKRRHVANIGLWDKDLAEVVGLDRDSEEYRQLHLKYTEFFLEQRFDPRIAPGWEASTSNGKYTLRDENPDLEKLFLKHDRAQYLVYPTPKGHSQPRRDRPFPPEYKSLVQQHCRQIIDRAKDQGYFDRLVFLTPVDEPRDKHGYQAIRAWTDAIRPLDPNVRVAVTEQPAEENPEWGTLVGHANTWIVNGNYVYDDPGSIHERKQAGDHVTWYISCDQLYPQPNYFIDREAADPRMVAWITDRYDMDGILYWTSNYWREVKDPWTDAAGWKRSFCNAPASGEGSLIYPGHLVKKFTGQDNVDGPVNSIRLALLREGMEELELLGVLRELGGDEVADEIVESICRDIRDFSRDPNAIDAARRRVIEEILKRQ